MASHPVIIIVVFSFGGLLLLGAALVGLWSIMKRRKKMVRKTEDIDVEGHLKFHETVAPGHHGHRVEKLDVEGDVKMHDRVRKSEVIKVGKGLHSDQAQLVEGKEDGIETEGTSSGTVAHDH